MSGPARRCPPTSRSWSSARRPGSTAKASRAAGRPVAEVALAATLGRNSDRQVLASFIAASRENAAENRQTSVVAALDAAFGRAAAELATRSFETIAADLASAERARSGGG